LHSTASYEQDYTLAQRGFTSTKRFDSLSITRKVRNSLSSFHQHSLLCDSSFHLSSALKHPQNYAMNNTSDPPGSSDTTSGNSTTSLAGSSEGAAQETMPSDSAPRIKDSEVRIRSCFVYYVTDRVQNKTSEEIADILQQWHEMEEQHDQTVARVERYRRECDCLHRIIQGCQLDYAMTISLLPPTLESDRLTPHESYVLRMAMDRDKEAGKATWTLYETQKKMVETCDALEKLMTFHSEHFVLSEADEQDMRKEAISIAATRHHLRFMASKMVEAHKCAAESIWRRH
jgi:hypothetical protein